MTKLYRYPITINGKKGVWITNVNMDELKLSALDKFKVNEYHIYLKGVCEHCNTEVVG